MRVPSVVAILAALCALGALTRAQEAAPTLSSQLAQAREAWLFADDAECEARVDALAADGQVGGDLARWHGGMAAAMKLKRGETAGAMVTLRRVLAKARDARAYFRATRLLLAMDGIDAACQLVTEGVRLHPESRALARLESEILWLQGKTDKALEAWYEMAATASSPRYPYDTSNVADWRQVLPWPESGEKAREPNAAAPRRDEAQPQGKEEPFCSLCVSPVWYETDLPALERCIMELARDEKSAKAALNDLDTLLARAQAAERALDKAKTDEERAAAGGAMRRTRMAALTQVRIAALFELGQGKAAQAEALARRGLSLWRADIGLLDVLVQALAAQGKAEEARLGPLSELQRLAQLAITSQTFSPRYEAAVYDRIFEAARVLHKANAQAAMAQFEALRVAFADPQEGTSVEPGNLGLWLLGKGERALARHYLELAAKAHKSDDAGATGGAWHLALLGLDLEGWKAAEPAGGAADWLGLAQRAGHLRALGLNLGAFMQGMGNPGIYYDYRVTGLASFARVTPATEAVLTELLNELPALIAARVKPEELDAVLDANSAETKQFQTLLTQFGALIDECLANRQNWEAREQAGQRALGVLCAYEARAVLILARFLQAPPKNLKDLSGWLARYHGLLDPGRTFRGLPQTAAQTQRAEERQKRGIPEIAHGALLVEAALALARNGQFESAGDLLQLNDRPWLDGIAPGRQAFLASLFYRKAGKADKELKAKLEASPLNDEQAYALLLPQFTQARKEILEFGGAPDVLEFVALRCVPWLGGANISRLVAQCPELAKANPNIWLRNSPQDGASYLFQGTFEQSSLASLYNNWPKVLMTGDLQKTVWRLAMWCVISDFPIQRSWGDVQFAATEDTLGCWRLLARTLERIGGDSKAAAERLWRLEQRCGGREVEVVEDESGPDYYPVDEEEE